MLTTSALQSAVFPTNKLENWNIYWFKCVFFYCWVPVPALLLQLFHCQGRMFARERSDCNITVGRLISNLIIPLINVWCLGALAGVRVTSVRLPETVKQTPAKPESRSQAKTLPVSSGLWTQDVHSRDLPELWSRFYWQIFFQQGKSEKSKCSC